MNPIFDDALHNQLGTWPIAYIPYGGADFGEILRVARATGSGDDSAFHAAWTHAADTMMREGEAAEAAGHRVSASEWYLRAAVFYGKAFHPLYGKPVDPRVPVSMRSQLDAFDRGLALLAEPITPQRIPFEGTSLLSYLIPARGYATQTRPLLILNNGYDAMPTDPYFASAVAATQRGYHCLIFDGPGQGTTLIEQGIPLRPDWETVIRPVVDFALTLPYVDPHKIVLSGWSLGGYLAP